MGYLARLLLDGLQEEQLELKREMETRVKMELVLYLRVGNWEWDIEKEIETKVGLEIKTISKTSKESTKKIYIHLT